MRLMTSLIASIIFCKICLFDSLHVPLKAANRGTFTKLNLNRIFCDIDETTTSLNGQEIILKLEELDYRCQHIKKILKLEINDSIKGMFLSYEKRFK